MGPRRTTLVLALLALGVLVASAGTAMASSCGDSRDGNWSSGSPSAPSGGAAPVMGAGSEHVHHEQGPDDAHGHDANHASGPDQKEPDATGGNVKGGDAVDGGVTGTSVDVPSAPVQAPAATASGPAPDAVAPAPIVAAAVVEAVVPVAPVVGTVGTDLAAAADIGAAPVADITPPVAAVAPPVDAPSFADLPVLGSIGALAKGVPDPPETARALLTTREGRSVAVLVALLAAVVLFLAVHRRVDRSDPKLSTARTGPDVAKFR